MTEIRPDTLTEALQAEPLSVVGVAEVAAQHDVDDSTKVSWHTKNSATIRVDWSLVPTQAAKDRVDTLLTAHDPLAQSDVEILNAKIKNKTATGAERNDFMARLVAQ